MLNDVTTALPELLKGLGISEQATAPQVDWGGDTAVMDRAKLYLAKVPPAVQGQNGSGACFHAACVLRKGFELTLEQSLDAIHEWNQTCQPPWSEAELRHKLEDAGKTSGETGYLRRAKPDNFGRISVPEYRSANPNHDDKTDNTQSGRVLSVLSSTLTDWPEPAAITGPEPVPMESADFPGFVGDMVKAVAENSETPVELPGLVALGVLATGCQQRFEIACDGQHTEPTNLWVCPALESGNRKTAVLNELAKPVRMFERSQRAAKVEGLRQSESLRRTLEKRIEALRTKAARAEDRQQLADIQREVESIERELPPVEYLPTLTADDCTPEHVGTLLSRHGERLTLLSDEAGIFELMAGRYSRGVPNLDVYLQGHAGGPVRVDRGSRESIDLERPALTVCVSPQPSVLEDIGKRKDFAGRGLLARFMFAVPQSRLGFRSHRPKPIPGEVSERWVNVVQRMLAIEQRQNDFGKPEPVTLYLSPEAYRLWKSEQLANELDMRPGNTCASQTAWASKYPGAVLRIAGVLHVALSVDRQQDAATEDVDGGTMQAAIQLGQKIKGQTLKAFGVMALNDDQRFAHKILEWVQRDNVKHFTGREAAIHCNSAGSSKELDGAFTLLAERGWIRQGEKQQPEGGGRPSQPWHVHPDIAKFTDKTVRTQPEGVSSVLSSTFENNRTTRPVPGDMVDVDWIETTPLHDVQT